MYDKYCRVCGYDDNEPYCFLETQFIRHFFTIATSKQFPFSNLWMVYIQLKITVYASMSTIVSEPCDLHCGVAEMRVTEKGVEVDMKCDVYSTRERKLMWSVVATLLSKHQKARSNLSQVMSVKENCPFSAKQGIWKAECDKITVLCR